MPITVSGTSITFNDATVQTTAATGGGFSGATVNAVGSSALTLTSSSTQYQVVQINSVANSVVNLPSATTMSTKGYPVFVIENAGLAGVPLQIKNNAGTILGSIPIGSIGTLTLEDNSTAAGVWVLNTDVVDYNYQSDSNSITTTATSPSVSEPNKTYTTGVVGLSSTLFVRYWVVNTTNAPTNTTATSTLYTQCITISGSTLTVGSTQSKQLDTFSASSGVAASAMVQVIRLSNSAFVVLQGNYRSGNDACGNSLQGYSRNFFTSTVSGTTVTFGTASNGGIPQSGLAQNNSNASNAGNANGTLVRLSDTSFSVVYNDGINNTYSNPYNYSGSLACQTVTVSGTTQTVGTKATLGTSTYSQVLSLGALSSTAIFACYAQAGSAGAQTGRTKVVVISISGTTSTFNTAVTYESADRAVFYAGDGYTTSSGTDKAVCPSSTQVIFASSYFYGEASISGTTPTINMINTNINVQTGSVFLTTASKAVLMGSPTAYLTIGTGGFSYQAIVSITPSPQSANAFATSIGFGSPLGAQPTTAFAHQTNFTTAILGTAL